MNAVLSPAQSFQRRGIAPYPAGRPTVPIFPPWRAPVAISEEQDVLSRRERDVFLSFSHVTSYRLPPEQQFMLLVVQWKQDNLFESSPWRMAAHPAYQRIIGMGRRAVPLVLRQLSVETDFWFEALAAITGEQPVLTDHAGNMEAMRQDWLRWGREHGYDC